MASREFDIILYGATGYTGALVAEHLFKTYGVGRDLVWAIAGRNAGKLVEVRDRIGAPAGLPLIIADAADPTSLASMVGKARAIISTVGPYQLYGSPLVAACAKAGTDYVDLTGESHWIAAMVAAHESEAKASGARLVFSCGFDSIPFDLGVFHLQREARARLGAPARRVRGRIRGIQGGLSGGTMASGVATMAAAQKDPSLGALLANPFALTPGFQGPAQPDDTRPYKDELAGSWVAPFMMAAINTKAVHRTNFLLGQPWGADFQYDEMMMVAGPEAGPGAGFSMNPAIKPGEGPTKEERENGWYDVLFIGETAEGKTIRTSVKGDKDPGYGSTSKMLGESAVCLVRDVDRATTPGGCWTTASAMGEALIKRLEANAGLSFTVES